MKRIALALASMLMVFLFAACAPAVTSGTVTGKDYTPYKTWTTQGGYQYTCLPGFDGKMDCKYKYSPFVTETHVQDECYGLDLQSEDDKSGSVCVSKTDYETIKVGDFWGTR